jgi:two-component system phosphate regulon sensor histidine kinase PhoR
MLSRKSLGSAIRALRTELAGGAGADLGREVQELQEVLAQRARLRHPVDRDPAEQELLSAFPDASAVVGNDGAIRVANAAFDRLAAGTRAAGQTPLEVTRSAELVQAIGRALEGTAVRLELELQQRGYEGHLSPLPAGEVLVLLHDVTDDLRAQTTRRDFVANASHELRTPISTICTAAEALQRGAVEDVQKARGLVEVVSRNATRLARLTQDLLDLSRIESRQWRPERLPVDLQLLGRAGLEGVAARAREKSLELLLAIPRGASVLADPRALEQVLANLLENAVKYTTAGTVTLGALRDDSDWVVSVRDTGPGIERHHLPRIFERFYRVDAGRSRDQGGTGLGLAIVKHLVQGMDGEVGVESGADGTRFWVRLPVA